MPLKYSFESLDDKGVVYGPVTLMPGELEFHIDTSGTENQYIAVYCNEPDYGARVYIFSESELLEAQINNSGVRLNVENLEEFLYSGFSYQRKIVDYEGECGRLVLQHVGPDGFIQSYN